MYASAPDSLAPPVGQRAITSPARARVPRRSSRLQRWNAWRKRSPLNPHWLDVTRLRNSVQSLAQEASGALLDIGCSERPYQEFFLPRVDRYVGLEYPPAVLDKQPDLWSIVDRAHGKVDLWADGNRLPFQNGAFDTVLCIEVLEHVPDPLGFLREAERVLAPGGTLLVTVPFSQPLHELPGDFYRFTPNALDHLIKGAGLDAERIEPRGNFPSATGTMLSQCLLRSLGTTHRRANGSVVLSRWRSTVLLPVLAVIQIGFHIASRFSSDTMTCQGYSVVARKRRAA